MFTGLIQEKGRVLNVHRQTNSVRLTCTASETLLEGYRKGDSMAIDGACLTAISVDNQCFTVEIMPETVNRTTFNKISVNDVVNLERALIFNGRIEGHFVAGHVDTTVRLMDKKNNANALLLTFDYPADYKGQIIAQGSIAINGVSLTVTKVTARAFTVSLIPHTKDMTNLGILRRGDKVNIETDLMGKYISVQRDKRIIGSEA